MKEREFTNFKQDTDVVAELVEVYTILSRLSLSGKAQV